MTVSSPPVLPTSILSAARRQRSRNGSLSEMAYRQLKDKIISLPDQIAEMESLFVGAEAILRTVISDQ